MEREYNSETPKALIHELQIKATLFYSDNLTEKEFLECVIFVAENIERAIDIYKTMYSETEKYGAMLVVHKYLKFIAKNWVDKTNLE